MSKQGFTPGPWAYDALNGEIFADVGDVQPRIATVDYSNTTLVQADADARLIAAAPDLYESVSDLLKMVEAAHRELGMWTKDNPRIAKARAALEKVRA